ncbi:hypothetical protein Rrhod_0957 [Rhodococcus rhodnii LMG 5362]|uniref:Uncharacterized protein n=1 Tax=Rhodococcus rhodnii LMG 5362 TaxID=1273125 RepID=R7WU66_9NOCA|nr:hypothetical protein Rrhod_0957 [Rhodococcus rhodnii LMG 5362]
MAWGSQPLSHVGTHVPVKRGGRLASGSDWS